MKKMMIGMTVAVLVLSTVICVSSLDYSEDTGADTSNIASVDGVGYDTLDKALASVESEGTIVITSDFTISSELSIPSGKIITIDMAGHTMTVSSSLVGRPFLNNGTLTIEGNGVIDASATANQWGVIKNYGTLTIENGTFKGNVGADASLVRTYYGSTTTINGGNFTGSPQCIYNEGTCVVNGGTFEGDSCATCGIPWRYTINNLGEMTFNGGEVIGIQGAFASSKGYTEIYGGTFTTKDCEKGHGTAHYALYVAGENGVTSCVVYGGTFQSYNKSAVYVGNSHDGGVQESAVLEVNGGSFSVKQNDACDIIYMDYETKEVPSASIAGGTFDRAVAESIIASEYLLVQNKDGTYGVVSSYAACIGDVKYKTLEDAVSAAQASEEGNAAEIKLLRDVELTGTLSFTKPGEYTLDIGAHTVTFTGSGYMVTVGGSAPPVYPIDTIRTSAKLTILGSGTINAQDGTVFRSYGTMVFGDSSGGPTVNYSSGTSGHSIFEVREGSYLTVNGGTFNLGTVGSDNAVTRVMQTYGTTVINNGTFNGDIELWFYSDAEENYTSEVTINGGTVGKLSIEESSDGSVQSTVVSNPAGTYSRVSVASIGEVYYASLSAAVSGAPSSGKTTITVFVNTDCVSKGGKDLTITTSGGAVLNHKQISGTAKSATCTEPGHTAGSSCACGAESTPQVTIPVKDHTPVQVPGKDATCTQDGYSSYTECSVCGTVLTERTIIPATGHSWDEGTITVQPTHTAEGVMEYKCTKCGETKTEAVPKIACSHTWDAGTVIEEATCSTDGSKLFTCTKCGETKTEAIPATGDHAWDSGTVIKEPTETESGIIEYKCTKCGQTKIAYIEPKKVEVEEKGDTKITTETEKVVEESEDGAVTETETKTVSKEENGKVTEKTETTKSVTVKDGSETVKETTVVEKEGQATEKTETTTSTSQREGSTIVSETKTVEKGQEKTETTVVSVKTEDGSVQTDVSVSDGSTSGIKTVISGDITDDAVATAVKQVEMASDAVSDKTSDVSKNIAVPADNVTLSPTSLNAIALSGASLTITGDAGGIEIDSNVASTMTSHYVDVTISIMEKKDGLTPAQKEKAGESKVIELSARSAVQEFHELGGKAKVRIDMTGMDYKSPEVYWLKDDGTSEKVNAEFGEGYAAIELDHFSLYYVAEGASEPSGNSNVLYIVAAVIVIAILAAAGYVAYKKRSA